MHRSWMQSRYYSLALLLLTLLTGSGLLAAMPARAAGPTCTVGPGGSTYSTIQEAANDPGCMTIKIAAGTYGEHVVIDRSLTLQGAGEDSTSLVPAPSSADSIVVIGATNPDITVHVSDLGVSNGHAGTNGGAGIVAFGYVVITRVKFVNNRTSGSGGGLQVGTRGATVIDSQFSLNQAASGGGIAASGDITVENTVFNGNTAESSGGGILVFGNLSLANGTFIANTVGTTTAFLGGGAAAVWGGATISNSTFYWNEAQNGSNGGAIAVWMPDSASQLSLANLSIHDNKASGSGGGIYVYGNTAILTNLAVASNTAVGSGGGLSLYTGTVTIKSSSFVSNSVSVSGSGDAFGGGIDFSNGRMSIVDSDIGDNRSEDAGGGVYNLAGRLDVASSTLRSNEAERGGGLFNQSMALVTNTTFSANRASLAGGGLSNAGSTSLVNVTFSQNAGNQGSSLYISAGSAQLKNTVLAGGTPNNCASAGVLTSLGHNLDSANSCGLAGPGDRVNTNPQLGPLKDNGGPTLTHALAPSSPATDSGTNSGCPVTDQRGVARPLDGDHDGVLNCDIGAYEYDGSSAPLSGFLNFLPFVHR